MNALFLTTQGDSVTTLAETLEIEGYGCALIEVYGRLSISDLSEELFLCSDITEDVFVNTVKLPVLRRLKMNSKGLITNTIEKPIWLTVTRQAISKVRLFICNGQGDIKTFSGRGLYCTLLLIPNRL